jgi:hypothetical protein
LAALTLPSIVVAQTSSQALGSISTPGRLPSSLGTLEFKDGAPSKETIAKVYDNLDLMHGVEAFVNAYQGASTSAIFKGMNEAGIPNNEAVIFSELMDSKSSFLTANADTVYFWMNIDASDGPRVLETPPMSFGVIDDMWFNWVTDFGLPGPDRGAGGKYLLVPPATRASCRRAVTSCGSCVPPAHSCWGGFRRQLPRWRKDLQGHSAQRYSGGEILVNNPLRQPDPLDA